MAAAAVAAPVSVPTGLGAREVVDLANPVFNLQRLENPQASLHQCGTKYGAQVIRSVFQKLAERDEKSNFVEINLSDNKIGDEGAEYLHLGLSGNTVVQKLYLPRCNIGAQGFGSIGKLLAENTSLEEVVLSSNVCDAAGVEGAFSEGLAKNKTLKSLYLGACRLGDKGVVNLCAGPMKSHPAVEHLSLTYNRLQAPCVVALNQMLSANSALRYLDLSGNSIGPEGAQSLVTGLKSNKGKLLKLSVAQNEIRQAGCSALAKFFTSAEGSHMEFLDLRFNLLTFKAHDELRKALGKPMDEKDGGWLVLFGKRQLFLNTH